MGGTGTPVIFVSLDEGNERKLTLNLVVPASALGEEKHGLCEVALHQCPISIIKLVSEALGTWCRHFVRLLAKVMSPREETP